MTDQNGNGASPDEFRLPEWVATLIGRLQLENEALRQALSAATQAQAPARAPEPADVG